ncbi:MAG: response regulator [Rhodobacteraceae bacterium]|nr:response regulator [Paracoccaceae bacterium]
MIDFKLYAEQGAWRDERLLKVITDKLPIGLAYVDPDKIYRFANSRFAAAYGLSPGAIVGMHADDFICTDTMELGDPFFEAAFKGTAVDYVHPVRHQDGRQMVVRTFLRPEISSSGDVLGFFVCSFNVTREKEAEARLLQAQKMDAVGQLASGIAHDFNNLLAVVIGNMAPLREKISDPALLAEYVDPTFHAIEQGVQLTQQLLAVARRQPLHPEPVDAVECVTSFLRLLRRTMRTDISVTTRFGLHLPAIYLDRAQFEVALLNLCLNARDAMPEGGEIVIALAHPSPEMGPGFVRLTLSDTGHGIPAEIRNQIFEPFFTTKASGKGTGLGLSMIWGFVKQSAGRIDLESEVGVGTTFLLDLPVAPHGETRPEAAPDEASRRLHGQGLVLVVDDNHTIRRHIGRDLELAGYTVIEAESGEEAVPLVEALDELCVLVSDVAMPGMSGYDLAETAMNGRPDLRIILMTAGEVCDTGRPACRLPILRKPFPIGDLLKKIESA